LNNSIFLFCYDNSFTGQLPGDKSYSIIFVNAKIKTHVPNHYTSIQFSEAIKRKLKWYEEEPDRMIIKKETDDWLDDIILSYE
jgi:hypothetical protein